MIEVENLSKKYIVNSEEIWATKNVSVTFEDEGMIFILGKSGSGKTTFLNLLAGLDCANQGAVKYEFLSDEDEKKILRN